MPPRWDYKSRHAYSRPHGRLVGVAGWRGYNLRFPHILGRDFSGVVAKTGEGVTDFAVGATKCAESWMPGSRARMRKSSPSRLQ